MPLLERKQKGRVQVLRYFHDLAKWGDIFFFNFKNGPFEIHFTFECMNKSLRGLH
jgi:hypothetical protein